MSIELVAVIITGVVSTMDFVINLASMCLQGHCRSSCCGCFFTHDDCNDCKNETDNEKSD